MNNKDTINMIQQLLTNKEGIVIGTDNQEVVVACDFDLTNIRQNTDALSKMTFLFTNLFRAMGLSEEQAVAVVKVGYQNTENYEPKKEDK